MNNIDFDAIDLTKEAPVTEPERQYYYIAKARKYVSRKSTGDRKRSDFLRDDFRLSDERS